MQHTVLSSEVPRLEVAICRRVSAMLSMLAAHQQAQMNAARPAPSHCSQALLMNNMQMAGEGLLPTAQASSLQVIAAPQAADAIWLAGL